MIIRSRMPMKSSVLTRVLSVAWMVVAFSCTAPPTETHFTDFYNSPLFHDVQMASVFPDSKTFVDCVPKRDINTIIEDYERAKDSPDFDLHEFVRLNFDLPVRPESGFASDTSLDMREHVTRLWPVLTRKADQQEPRSSLIPLPYDYVVPGGRFSEIYYWDSYFTILGLQTEKRYDLIASMVKNFSHLIDQYGFIPNGNRNYYLTRSQPPFFSLIVRTLEDYDTAAASTYLEPMEKEYRFWMSGTDSLNTPGDAINHVVMMGNGSILNRYYDRGDTPRPESYREDYTLAQETPGDDQKLYRNIRAAAASGWDFSSRWFADGQSLATIHTTDIIPVDLNCLLAHLEVMIAKGYAQRGDEATSQMYRQRADQRRRAIMTYCWDAKERFFFDYDFVKEERCTVKSLAGVFPLFFEMVPDDVAQDVASVIRKEFLKPGGVVTTLNQTGQQWDAPNGWAPLQWITYRGLKNYDAKDLAEEVRLRWLRQTKRVYESTGKMMEKYNVMDTTLLAGGGEYPNQDGFGWTNGVSLRLLSEGIYELEKK